MATLSWWAKNSSLESGKQIYQLAEEDLNILTANSLISRGPLVFILMLMVIVGTVVNTIVTVVFLKRFPASAIRSYMVTMSVSDLVATGIAIPMHIYTVLNVYNFSDEHLCQAYFVLCSLSTNCSSFVVVLLARDRYRRVRHPVFGEIERIRSYYQVGLAVFLAVLVTAPFVSLYGICNVKTTLSDNLLARMCWVDQKHEGTLYPVAYDVVLGLTFGTGIIIICHSYGLIGFNIFRLSKDISDEIQYRLSNPPPPSNLPDIYAEDVPEELSDQSEKLDLPAGPTQSTVGFAARLHVPREAYTGLALEPDAGEGGRKVSRIKKISAVIQQMFTPVPPSSPVSSSGSSFVSDRANTTVVNKTIASPRGSLDIPMPLQTGPVSRPPKFKKLSMTSAYVVDSTTSGTSTTTMTSQKIKVPLAEASQNKTGNADVPSPSPPDNTSDTTDKSAPASQSSKHNLPPAEKAPAAADSPSPATSSPELSHQLSLKASNVAATAKATPIATPITIPVSTAVSPETMDRIPGDDEVKTPAWVEKNRGLEASPVWVARPSYYTVQRTQSEELASLEHMELLRGRSNTMMAALVFLYVVTWLPNFLSRVISKRAANLCPGFGECWLNGPAYFICSVYISSTVNAFVYCFGSVHFRKHVTLFFKPCQDKICKPRRKKVIRVVRRRKKSEQRSRKPIGRQGEEVVKMSKGSKGSKGATSVSKRKHTPAPTLNQRRQMEDDVDGSNSRNGKDDGKVKDRQTRSTLGTRL